MSQQIKRTPTVADLFLASDTTLQSLRIHDKLARHVQRVLREDAHRFVLDMDATGYFAEMCKSADLIINGMPFAIPPFERTWIEMPFRHFYAKVNGTPADPDADEHVAYLFDGPLVYSFAANVSRQECGMSPLRYRLNRPLSADEEERLHDKMGMTRLHLDMFFWGSTAGRIYGNKDANVGDVIQAHKLSPEQIRKLAALREQHGVEIVNNTLTDRDYEKEAWSKLYLASAGDLRNLIGLLLFINQPSSIRYDREVPPMPRMIHNKARTLLRHTVIKMHVDPTPRLRARFGGGAPGAFKRLHDVRGHWCMNKIARAPGCEHQWSEIDYDHFRCMSCGGQRWHRKEHQRGKRAAGRVKQTYQVTK